MLREERYIEYKDINGDTIVFPYLLIEGEGEGPTVCITAGIHGCEYPPVAAAIALFKKLDPKALKGTIKIIPIADMEAFHKKTMFVCPKDGKNINRNFPGIKDGTYSEALAYNLFNDFMKNSDYYIDLHCADLTETMMPFCEIHISGNKKIDEISFNMAKYSGITDIVLKSNEGEVNDKGQSYSAAADAGVPSVLINAGQIDGNLEKYMSIHLKGLFNILKYLRCMEGSIIENDDYICYKAPVHIRSRSKGIFYCNYKVGDEVEAGDVLGKVEDVFGNELEVVKVPAKGRILLINTGISVKQNTLLIEIIVKI